MLIYQIIRRDRDGTMSFFIEFETAEHAMRVQRALVLDGNTVSVSKIPVSQSTLKQTIIQHKGVHRADTADTRC